MKENLKTEILELNRSIIDQLTKYEQWYFGILFLKEKKIKVSNNEYLKELGISTFPYDFQLIGTLQNKIESYVFLEDNIEIILSKVRFIDELIQYWSDIITQWDLGKENVMLSEVMTEEVFKSFEGLYIFQFGIKYENTSIYKIDAFILKYFLHLKDYIIEVKGQNNFTSNQQNVKLIWKGQKNQLYNVLRQLKNLDLIGNSYNNLADFLIENVSGFENTSKETIEKEIKKIKDLPKPKRINIDANRED